MGAEPADMNGDASRSNWRLLGPHAPRFPLHLHLPQGDMVSGIGQAGTPKG
jgi:hypothetical protein